MGQPVYVVKTIEIHYPFGNGLYHLSMGIWGMDYIIHVWIISPKPSHGKKKTPHHHAATETAPLCWRPTLCRNCPPWPLHGASRGSSASLPGAQWPKHGWIEKLRISCVMNNDHRINQFYKRRRIILSTVGHNHNLSQLVSWLYPGG